MLATYEAKTTSNNHHYLHIHCAFQTSQKIDNMLSANVFLTCFFAWASHFIW